MSRLELLQGTLDTEVLGVLQSGPIHRRGIAQRLAVLSREVIQVEGGDGEKIGVAIFAVIKSAQTRYPRRLDDALLS